MPHILHDLRRSIPLKVLSAAALVFALGSLSDLWLYRYDGSLGFALLDDALVALAAGAIVLIFERREWRRMIAKLEMVRLMNHHVRNSLQVICYAASVEQRQDLAKNLYEAIEQIEWTLKEVLPGTHRDINQMFFERASKHSTGQQEKTVA